MEKLKVALVGTGGICGTHMRLGYSKRDDVEVVACADIDFAKAQRFAEKWNIPKVFDSVEALLAGSDPDIVDVCTWPAAHAVVSIAAANAGKHVICEKPTCHNMEHALALRDAVKKNGIIFELAVPQRYRREAMTIRDLVDKGEFGDVFYGKTSYNRQRGIPGGWFSCTKYSGGGPIIDIGVHRIDLAWYLMGCPKPISVSATASYRIGDYRDEKTKEILSRGTYDEVTDNNAWVGTLVPDYKFDVEDSACGFFRFENGASLYFETSWTFNGPENFSTQIAGDKAGVTLEPLKLYRASDNKLIEEDLAINENYGEDHFYNEFDHFINCIRTGATPSSNIEQAVQMEAMLCGIYESARLGREIEIKL